MASKWPEFITKDLGDTPEDDAEMHRRWSQYEREMRALIAAGRVHQDADGWWVDNASGELIGPDPEIERPSAYATPDRARPFADAFPDLAENIVRGRGRPALANPKKQVTLRIDADVLDRLRSGGKGWQKRVNDVLKKSVGL
jgi:uncharacterized protein (DUF4415 family)